MLKKILLILSILGPIINYVLFIFSATLLVGPNSYSLQFLKILPVTIGLGVVGIIFYFINPNKIISFILISLMVLTNLIPLYSFLYTKYNADKYMVNLLNDYLVRNNSLDEKQIIEVLEKIDNTKTQKELFKKLLENNLIDPNFVLNGVNGKYNILTIIVDKKYDIDYMKYLLLAGANPNLLDLGLPIMKRVLSQSGDMSNNDGLNRIKILINCGADLRQVDFKNQTLLEDLNNIGDKFNNKIKINELIKYIEDVNSGKIKQDCSLIK